MNPFGLANDINHSTQNLVIDQELYNYDYWAFHPMDNTATVEMAKDDFLKFLDSHKVKYVKMDLLQKPVENKQ